MDDADCADPAGRTVCGPEALPAPDVPRAEAAGAPEPEPGWFVAGCWAGAACWVAAGAGLAEGAGVGAVAGRAAVAGAVAGVALGCG